VSDLGGMRGKKMLIRRESQRGKTLIKKLNFRIEESYIKR